MLLHIMVKLQIKFQLDWIIIIIIIIINKNNNNNNNNIIIIIIIIGCKLFEELAGNKRLTEF